MKYLIHTYRHASGHNEKVRRVVYTAKDFKRAAENFQVLGGRLEVIDSLIEIEGDEE